MSARPVDDEEHSVEIAVRVDLRTAAWLTEVADILHAPPAQVAGAMLRDICVDDLAAHDDSVEMPSTAKH